jgi:hypothetical protein
LQRRRAGAGADLAALAVGSWSGSCLALRPLWRAHCCRWRRATPLYLLVGDGRTDGRMMYVVLGWGGYLLVGVGFGFGSGEEEGS